MTTLFAFFFIELGTRRVYLDGVTEHPDGAWVAQQARNTVWLLDEREADSDLLCLIRDNDKKFTSSFDAVFESEGMKIIRTLPDAQCECTRRKMGKIRQKRVSRPYSDLE